MQRSSSNAFGDWSRETVLVELKSSSFLLGKQRATWTCRFMQVKRNFFDQLWLAIYSPRGIYLNRADCPGQTEAAFKAAVLGGVPPPQA